MPKIWLDDERDPTINFVQMHFGADGDEIWAKTASVAINYLKQGNITSISFDHDLGTSDTGLTVAKWIEEQAYLGNIPKLIWFVHSMNPVGAKSIIQAMTRADQFWDSRT